MKEKINRFISALNPLLLFAGAYFIALIFSVTVCLSIFNKYNEGSTKRADQLTKTNELILTDYKTSAAILK